MQARVVREVPRTGRSVRNPSHSFQIEQKPYAITPFLLAPVLPGETLNTALMQARGRSDAIKSELTGWWVEYYFFYVKHRHMPDFEHFKNMVMTPGYNITPAVDPVSVPHYMGRAGINWSAQCMEPIVREFFRDEDEPWNNFMLDSVPMASINAKDWTQSAKSLTGGPLEADDAMLPGLDFVDDDKDIVPGFEAAYIQWENMRALKLTDATYEDWIRQFGVTPPPKEREDKPELLRYVRDWSYPGNIINPATGASNVAMSWAVNERLDKPRFFNEPGFVYGVSVIRPKVYLSRQISNASSMMADAYSWLPAMLSADPYTSLRQFAGNAGPLADMTEGYWIDVRDLLIYGDQFVNYTPTAAGKGAVALPTAGMQKKYVSPADIDSLFTVAAANKFRQDGIVSLNVKSNQKDYT